MKREIKLLYKLLKKGQYGVVFNGFKKMFYWYVFNPIEDFIRKAVKKRKKDRLDRLLNKGKAYCIHWSTIDCDLCTTEELSAFENRKEFIKWYDNLDLEGGFTYVEISCNSYINRDMWFISDNRDYILESFENGNRASVAI